MNLYISICNFILKWKQNNNSTQEINLLEAKSRNHPRKYLYRIIRGQQRAQ